MKNVIIGKFIRSLIDYPYWNDEHFQANQPRLQKQKVSSLPDTGMGFVPDPTGQHPGDLARFGADRTHQNSKNPNLEKIQ